MTSQPTVIKRAGAVSGFQNVTQAQLWILKVFFFRVWCCEKVCILSGKSFLLPCVADLLVLLKHGAFSVSLFLQEVCIQVSVNNVIFQS